MHAKTPLKSEFKALVGGVAYTDLPDDLFIPPDALEVLLDSFSGPLDLLLYLIRKHNIDILNIPMMSITRQYLQYINAMELIKLELAADYLLMAATLAEIKARLLLPVAPKEEGEEEDDPRMALVQRLLAYEQIKQAAQVLDVLPRQDRDTFILQINPDVVEQMKIHPEVDLSELVEAMCSLMKKEDLSLHHEISRESLSVRQRMSLILAQLQENKYLNLRQLFLPEEGLSGLVVSLLAILELARQSLLVITQAQAFSPIHIKAA
ncbi:MAG: segregation and condensation protein A [Legionellales bacterium]